MTKYTVTKVNGVEVISPRRRKSPTGAARIARYRIRRAREGLVEIRVWVPASAVDRVKRFAAELRGTPLP